MTSMPLTTSSGSLGAGAEVGAVVMASSMGVDTKAECGAATLEAPLRGACPNSGTPRKGRPAARLSSPSPAKRVERGKARKRLRGCLTDRKSTRLNSSHSQISYAVFCLKKKKVNQSVKVFELSSETLRNRVKPHVGRYMR